MLPAPASGPEIGVSLARNRIQSSAMKRMMKNSRFSDRTATAYLISSTAVKMHGPNMGPSKLKAHHFVIKACPGGFHDRSSTVIRGDVRAQRNDSRRANQTNNPDNPAGRAAGQCRYRQRPQ